MSPGHFSGLLTKTFLKCITSTRSSIEIMRKSATVASLTSQKHHCCLH